MATVNIPSYHDDPNYRYKMPRVKAKTEGRGNGVKTNIMNMGEIARALKRAPEYPTKFCGCELGALSKFESAEGKAIVNGVHSEADVQTVIDKFIERFVLCPKCKLPEIDLMVQKGRVQGKCNACGYSGDMDNVHKVATFIIKNPPDGGDSTMGKKGGKSKKSAQAPPPVIEDEEEKRRRKEKRKAEKTEKAEKAEKGEKIDKGDKIDKEKKKDKRHKHKHHHKHRPAALTVNSEEVEQVIERLKAYIAKGEKPLPKDFFQEVRLLQVAQDFSSTIRVYVTLAALFPTPEALTPASLKTSTPYINAVCDRSIDEETVLAALELFAFKKCSSGIYTNYALILHGLYNADIVDEEAILTRYGGAVSETPSVVPAKAADDSESTESKPQKECDADELTALQKAHAAANSFVKWLKEAESASDDESSDESKKVPVMGSGNSDSDELSEASDDDD